MILRRKKRIVKRHTFQTYRRQKALNYSKLKKWEEAPIKAEQEDQDSPPLPSDVVPMPWCWKALTSSPKVLRSWM